MNLRILSCFVLLSITVSAQESSHRAQMSIPGVQGVLVFDAGTKFETRVRPDSKEVQLRAFGRTDGLDITAFLQRVTFAASAEKCRDAWWPDSKKSPLPKTDIQEKPVENGMARAEYIIPEFQGVKVQQKNVHAYLGSRDLCAEIHLSKAGFRAEDENLFDDLLSSVRLMPEVSASTK
jgi:hypothetical protein